MDTRLLIIKGEFISPYLIDNMNKFVKTIPTNKVYTEYLRSINGILELTDREIQLLGYMMEIQVKISLKTNDIIKSITATPIRKQIFKELGISKSNYINYLKTYKSKGLLIKVNEDSYFVNDKIFPIIIGDRVQITIVLKLDETNK